MKCELLGFLIPDKQGKMNWKQKNSQTNKWLTTTVQLKKTWGEKIVELNVVNKLNI